MLVFLSLLFPDGQLPISRWWWLHGSVAILMVAACRVELLSWPIVLPSRISITPSGSRSGFQTPTS